MSNSTITFATNLFLEEIQNSPKDLWASNTKLFFCGFHYHLCSAASSQFLQPHFLTLRLLIYIAMATPVRSFSHFPLSVPIKEIHHTFHPCFHYMANCVVTRSLLHLHHHDTFHFLSSDPSPPFPDLQTLVKNPLQLPEFIQKAPPYS